MPPRARRPLLRSPPPWHGGRDELGDTEPNPSHPGAGLAAGLELADPGGELFNKFELKAGGRLSEASGRKAMSLSSPLGPGEVWLAASRSQDAAWPRAAPNKAPLSLPVPT